jgi:hypothetical protein
MKGAGALCAPAPFPIRPPTGSVPPGRDSNRLGRGRCRRHPGQHGYTGRCRLAPVMPGGVASRRNACRPAESRPIEADQVGGGRALRRHGRRIGASCRHVVAPRLRGAAVVPCGRGRGLQGAAPADEFAPLRSRCPGDDTEPDLRPIRVAEREPADHAVWRAERPLAEQPLGGLRIRHRVPGCAHAVTVCDAADTGAPHAEVRRRDG